MKTKYILISIPILLVLLYTFNARRKNDLIDTGTRTRGQVIQASKVFYFDNARSKHKIEYYQVHISFTADGEKIVGIKEMQVIEYERRRIVEGDTVDIVYDRENPHEFILSE